SPTVYSITAPSDTSRCRDTSRRPTTTKPASWPRPLPRESPSHRSRRVPPFRDSSWVWLLVRSRVTSPFGRGRASSAPDQRFGPARTGAVPWAPRTGPRLSAPPQRVGPGPLAVGLSRLHGERGIGGPASRIRVVQRG